MLFYRLYLQWYYPSPAKFYLCLYIFLKNTVSFLSGQRVNIAVDGICLFKLLKKFKGMLWVDFPLSTLTENLD